MKETFTLKEIEHAIALCPKHNVHLMPRPEVDDLHESDIKTIEVVMLWFRLFGSNKKDWDEYIQK